jgi:hypothetical protein
MAPETGRVLSVNVGGVRKFDYHGRPAQSAIWKSPVTGRVAARGVNLGSPSGSRGTRRLRQGRLRVFGGGPTLVGRGDRASALLRRVRREPDHGRDRAQRRAGRRALADRERGFRGFRAANSLLAARRPDERRSLSTPLHQGVATRYLSENRRRGRCGRRRRDPGPAEA